MRFLTLLLFLFNSILIFSQTEKIQRDEKGNIISKKIYDSEGAICWKIKYHSNGIVSDSLPYVDSKVNGVAKSYSKKGKLTYEKDYLNGKIDGKKRCYLKKSTLIIYYKNGVSEKIFHVIEYIKNGSVKSEFNNKIIGGYGPYKIYYKNGQLKLDAYFTGVKRDGTWKFYNKNGSLRKTKSYNNKFIIFLPQYI
jgi:uncharacterized protein